MSLSFPRLRLGRMGRLVLLFLVVVVAADAVLLYGYTGAEDRRERADRQVRALESTVNRMRRPEDLEALKKELSDLEGKLDSNPMAFPKDIDNLQLTGLVVRAASQTGVDIRRVEIGAQGAEQFGGHDYRSFKYTVTARGQLGQLVTFLNRLETSGFNTLVISGQNYALDGGLYGVAIDVTAYAQKA